MNISLELEHSYNELVQYERKNISKAHGENVSGRQPAPSMTCESDIVPSALRFLPYLPYFTLETA